MLHRPTLVYFDSSLITLQRPGYIVNYGRHIERIIRRRRPSIKFLADIVQAVGSGDLAVLTLLDLSAAFDTVDHGSTTIGSYAQGFSSTLTSSGTCTHVRDRSRGEGSTVSMLMHGTRMRKSPSSIEALMFENSPKIQFPTYHDDFQPDYGHLPAT